MARAYHIACPHRLWARIRDPQSRERSSILRGGATEGTGMPPSRLPYKCRKGGMHTFKKKKVIVIELIMHVYRREVLICTKCKMRAH
jgi:hypothetical protein